MIYATGDTHGDFFRFTPGNFPEQENMTHDDFVVILGDFGGIWGDQRKDRKKLEQLNRRSFTTLWVDGNHENYDKLSKYPITEWHGGKVQFIQPNIIHLMRGQIYNIHDHKIFVMGGAQSHDIEGGILNPNAPDFEEEYWAMRRAGNRFRVNHVSWWKQELPSEAEYEETRKNLEKVNYKVDQIWTHSAPSSVVDIIGRGEYSHDHLTDFLQWVHENVEYKHWLCGHYHENKMLNPQFAILYEQIIPIIHNKR